MKKNNEARKKGEKFGIYVGIFLVVIAGVLVVAAVARLIQLMFS